MNYLDHILDYFENATRTKLAPETISHLEIVSGLEKIKEIILDMIKNTKKSLIIVMPTEIPEFLNLSAEHAFSNKKVNITFYCYWNMEMYKK